MNNSNGTNVYFGLARIGLGLIFLWAFFDKLLGLGYATKSTQAWITGGSPTVGFLTNATKGPFIDLYHGLAGNPIVDWLFMLGLLGLGIALIFGIGIKIAGYAGAILMLLLWSSVLPPSNNPILDEHIIYALLLLGFSTSNLGDSIGFGRQWSNTSLVQKYRFLR